MNVSVLFWGALYASLHEHLKRVGILQKRINCYQSLICSRMFFHRQGRSVNPLHVSIFLLDVFSMCLGSGYISAHSDVLSGSYVVSSYIIICIFRTYLLYVRNWNTNSKQWISCNTNVTSCLVCYHALSVSPVITSSCQTLPVIVKDLILSPCGSFGPRHLILLDPPQHLFLLRSLCSSLKVTLQTQSASFTPAFCTRSIYTPASACMFFFYGNAVQKRVCVFHICVSNCAFQRRVWGWKNRKHKESDPVFGSCCLLP